MKRYQGECGRCAELNKRIAQLRTTLKVIHTWSSYVSDDGSRPAFNAQHIADKCVLALNGDNE